VAWGRPSDIADSIVGRELSTARWGWYSPVIPAFSPDVSRIHGVAQGPGELGAGGAGMDIAHLKKIPLFSNLTSDHLAKVAAIGREVEVPGSHVVFREGDVGTDFYVIVSGRVRISKMVPGVGEEALAILEPGSYFGEMALIDDTPRSADAISHTPCKLWVMQKQDLEELMFLHKDLAYELLWTFVRTLSTRLRETNDKIKAFFALSARF